MGKELADKYPVARRTFEEADEALGYKLSQLCFEGPEEKLRMTEVTQPAILTASVAAWRVLQEKGVNPGFVAGHSLGEYSAHVAAGTLNFADAVRTVRNRGQYMQEAVPVGVGAMAAILGMDLEKVTAVCTDAAQGEVCEPANINSAEQIVISGHAAAVERATKLASERRRQAGHYAVRQRAFSLLADEACAGPAVGGLEVRDVAEAGNSGRVQCRCGDRGRPRFVPGCAGPPGNWFGEVGSSQCVC